MLLLLMRFINTINYLQLRTQELSPEDFTKHIKVSRQEEEIIIYFDHQNNVVKFDSKFISFLFLVHSNKIYCKMKTLLLSQ